MACFRMKLLFKMKLWIWFHQHVSTSSSPNQSNDIEKRAHHQKSSTTTWSESCKRVLQHVNVIVESKSIVLIIKSGIKRVEAAQTAVHWESTSNTQTDHNLPSLDKAQDTHVTHIAAFDIIHRSICLTLQPYDRFAHLLSIQSSLPTSIFIWYIFKLSTQWQKLQKQKLTNQKSHPSQRKSRKRQFQTQIQRKCQKQQPRRVLQRPEVLRRRRS